MTLFEVPLSAGLGIGVVGGAVLGAFATMYFLERRRQKRYASQYGDHV
jgi:hypothetical protein